MQYRLCGNSGLRLPEISTGTWLTAGYNRSEKEMQALMHYAYEQGSWLVDTADVYDAGEAERWVGRFLKSIQRSELILATKAFGQMGTHPLSQGLSRRHLMNACEASLMRLETDYIDLYQCHRYDVNTPLTEVLETMHTLVQQGKIRYWGVSQWTAVQITNAVRLCEQHNWVKPISNQPIYNMLNRSLETDVMRVCEKEGLGLICYSPLAQGLLTGKYTSADALPEGSRAADEVIGKAFPFKRMTAENLDKINQLRTIASELNVSLSRLALAWCLRVPCITSLITSYSSTAQVDENLGASGMILSEIILGRIEKILDNAPVDQYTGNRTGYGTGEGGY